MTQLTGIKDGEYLAQFLGKKIAIKEQDGTISVYHQLIAIFSDHKVWVIDTKEKRVHQFTWEQCESPYVILMEKNVVMK